MKDILQPIYKCMYGGFSISIIYLKYAIRNYKHNYMKQYLQSFGVVSFDILMPRTISRRDASR